MEVAVVKYNAGNVHSVTLALQRLGHKALLTDHPEELRAASHVIFPGVGEASTAMAYLRQHKLDTLIPSLRQPVLGICLGLQLLCQHSEEGNTDCLGVFPVQVKRFDNQADTSQKVPHMGWNTVEVVRENALVPTQGTEPWYYFVHSYYAELSPYTLGTCHYAQPFSALLNKDNFWAAQFHPEKSGEAGATLLENFLRL